MLTLAHCSVMMLYFLLYVGHGTFALTSHTFYTHLTHTHTHTHTPHHLALQDGTHVKRLERLCDAVVRLESFTGSNKEQNPLYKDYHGES